MRDEYPKSIPKEFQQWYRDGVDMIEEFSEFKSYIYSLNTLYESQIK